MKRTLLLSAIAAVMFAVCFAWICFTSGQAAAQPPVAPVAQGPGGIALVDVNFIFKKHARLHDGLKALQSEAENVQKGFEGQLRDLQQESQKLAQLKVGSPEYQALEEQLVSKKSIIQGQIALKRKEFEQKEAHMYFTAYREITDEVTYFCQQRGVALVLNYSRDAINDQVPQDVARGISNKVVYCNRGLDITDIILPRFVRTEGADNRPSPIGVGVYPQPH